jgi:hypothetical protein
MQNAQNLMSSFEFIAALMSIIIGLGVTNLLAGVGRAFYRRKENPLDEVHLVFTVATLLLLVLQWWVTFKWNTEVNWTFDKFLVLIAWTVVLYLLTVCSTSRKRPFTANFSSRSGTFRSLGNMRFLPAAVSLSTDGVTIGSSPGTNW